MLVYLENERENSFWEVEQEGTKEDLLTIRQGQLGRAGKSRGLWLEEGRTVQQLVDAKKEKGYVEVSPAPQILLSKPEGERLPGESLRESEVALFSPALISRPSEAQCNYWRKQMSGLLREKVYRGPGRLSYIGGMRTLAEEYEAIASWDSPAMDKEVCRDDRGMVTEIRYSINGLVVLRLENKHTGHEGYPPIQPFFTQGLPSHYGYQYGKKKTLVEEARQLLIYYPAFLVEHLPLVAEAEVEVNKAEKLRSIAQGGISVLVDNLMRGTGYEYRLLAEGKRSRLLVLLDEERYMELSLPNGSFQGRIGHVVSTVELVKSMCGELQIPVRYTNGASRIAWGTVQHHEANYYSWGEDPRHLFWQEQYRSYVKRMQSLDSSCESLPEVVDLEMVAPWKFPGLEQRVREEKGSPSRIVCVSYFIEGRCVLYLHPTAMIFPLGGYSNENLYEGKMPTLSTLKEFLKGLVDFYRKGEELFNSQFSDGEWMNTILAQVESIGLEWHIDLSHQSRVVLRVRHSRNGVIDVVIPKERLGLAQGIQSVVARVQEVIKASRMAFKIETLYREGGFKKG